MNFTDGITYVLQAETQPDLRLPLPPPAAEQPDLSERARLVQFQRTAHQPVRMRNGQPVSGTGFDFADFLLGLPQSSSLRFGSDNNYFRGWATGAYAQDDFRISRGLSFNFGLRYEYFAPYTELLRPPRESGSQPRIHRGCRS